MNRRFLSRLIAPVAATFALLAAGTASAAVILSETFEGPAVGAAISTSNSIFTAGATASSGNNSFRVQNTNPPTLPAGNTNPFTGTKYLEYLDGSAGPAFNAPIAAGTLTNTNFYFAVDYFEPLITLDAGFTTHTNTGFFLAVGNSGVTNTNRALGFTLSGGTTGSIAVGLQGGDLDSTGPSKTATVAADQHIHFDLYGNTSASPSGYLAPTFQSLAPHSVDVYANGVLIINDGPFRHIDQIAGITRLGLNIANGSAGVTQQKAYFDNILLKTMAAPVPEPSTWALVLLGFAGFGYMRRKWNY